MTTDLLRALFATALTAADPATCLPRVRLPQPPKGRSVVVAIGKAACSMTRALQARWQGPLEGIVLTRYGHALDCPGLEVIEAAHPVPDAKGRAAAGRILQLVEGLGVDDLLLMLISGGGSALLSLPAQGLTLAQKQDINRQLLASGAPIHEMNVVRKHLSAVKGGRLAAAAFPAEVQTILISDVPGDDPATIASGPTVGDPSTSAEALAILARCGITPPEAVTRHLHDPASETPKPEDPIFVRACVQIALRPADMLEAVAAHAREAGYEVVCLGAEVEGEAREVAAVQAAQALAIARDPASSRRGVILLSGGETTVTLRNRGGKGGRNLEYLLALALALEGEARITALACDTDGLDGSEENAGGLLDPLTLARARSAGIDPGEALAQNQSYEVFKAAGGLITTGPTLTNVNDIRIIKIDPLGA